MPSYTYAFIWAQWEHTASSHGLIYDELRGRLVKPCQLCCDHFPDKLTCISPQETAKWNVITAATTTSTAESAPS